MIQELKHCSRERHLKIKATFNVIASPLLYMFLMALMLFNKPISALAAQETRQILVAQTISTGNIDNEPVAYGNSLAVYMFIAPNENADVAYWPDFCLGGRCDAAYPSVNLPTLNASQRDSFN